MKNILLFILLYLLIGCETTYDTPEIEQKQYNFETTLNISNIVSNLDIFEENIETFDYNAILEGYVVSSDQSGNFYKELILQNAPENAQRGIALQIDENNLFERFVLGSKIFIQLNGLSVAYQNGIIKLGILKENSIERLSAFDIDQHIFRDSQQYDIIPKELTLDEISTESLNQLVHLKSLQFDDNLLFPETKTLANETSDNFDGLRALHDCVTNLEIQLSTSTFSNFKNYNLPISKVNVEGILTRNYENTHYVLKMNRISNLSINNEERCINEFYECNTELSSLETDEIIFEENFNSVTNEIQLDDTWINLNITGDEKRWTDKKITNIDNRVMTLSAYNSNLTPLHAWLVTPEIEIDPERNPVLHIRLRTLYNNGNALKIWMTTNFEEDIESSTWEQINVELPVISSNYMNYEINLNCVEGNSIRIGFEYKGYDNILTSTYDIDEIKVTQ